MVQALLPFNPAFRAQVAIFAGDWCGSMSSVRLLCVGRSATCQNSVIIGPGHTARTLIFLGFNSSRSAREKLLLGKVHIGEVQASLWDEETRRVCAEKGVILL